MISSLQIRRRRGGGGCGDQGLLLEHINYWNIKTPLKQHNLKLLLLIIQYNFVFWVIKYFCHYTDVTVTL